LSRFASSGRLSSSNFAGLYKEILKDFFIGAEAHVGAP